ncbi:MAG: serine/threonine-protein kinase [Planctomycetota bacterium]
MDTERYQRIREALQEAGRLDGDARRSYLEGVPDDVRGEVQRLLGDDVITGDLFPAPTPPPERCGPYRIEKEIGRGGMGVVYEATDGERRVAVKVLHPHVPHARFEREAKLGLKVDHENVVRTLDAGEDYLVMEYVKGKTLRELAGEWGTIPETLLREIARQAAAGLRSIHRAGIVHRDLKPENILIDDLQRVRIMDLGIAKALEGTVQLTSQGQFLGSMNYAAPEQWEGEPVGWRADVYSLGVVLYELATGANPFQAESASATIKAHLDSTPMPVAQLNPDLSTFFSEVVRTMLAKRPEDRDVGDAFEEGEEGTWWAAHQRARMLPRIPVRRDTPLRGRDGELGFLREAWRAGHAVVLLEGEAGVGKTRLIDEFLQGLEDAHILYGAFTAARGMGGLTDAIRAKFGSEEQLAPYLAETPRLLPDFAAFLRDETAMEGGALQAACCRFLGGLADEKPTVWVIEDLHHAPGEARAVVEALARAGRGLLIATARRGFRGLEGAARLALGRLAPDDVVAMVGDEVRGRIIAQKAEGVPLFVVELMQAEGAEIPSAIRDILGARLEGLSDEARMILDAGAVQGFEFDAELVARVLERPLVKVLQDLAQMERQAGLVRAAGRRYRFDHKQLQEMLYVELPPRLREEYHALLAEAHADDDAHFLAWHHLRGSRPQKGLPHVIEALEHLHHRHLSEAVIELAELALPHLEGEERAEVLVRLERGQNRLGRIEGAPLDEALTLAQTPALRARVLEALAYHHARGSNYEDALAALGLAAELALTPETDLRVAGAYSHVLWRIGEKEAAKMHAQRQLDLARELDDHEQEMLALSRLGVAHMALGDHDAALEMLETNIEVCRRSGFGWSEAVNVGNLGVLHIRRGRWAEALKLYESALDLSRDVGYRQGEVIAMYNQGEIWWNLGRADKGQPWLDQGLALARELARPHLIGMGLLLRGKLDGDEDALHEALELYRRIGSPTDVAGCLLYLGKLDEAAKIAKEARARGHLLLALARRGDVEPTVELLENEEARLGLRHQMEARFYLWEHTGYRTHLEEAKRILQHLQDHAPAPYRASMIENVALHRAIHEAEA